MSGYTDFYVSWLGNNSFGNTPSRTAPAPAPAPVVFTPLDISDCYLWFNCDDTTTMALSNVTVLSFSNLGLASAIASNTVGEVTVVQDVNNLNVLNFASGTQLEYSATLPYLDRTQFVVFKSLSDMSNATYPYLTFTSGGYSAMQTGVNWDSNSGLFQYSMCQNGLNCPVLGTTSNNPLSNATMVTYVSESVGYSNNALYINDGSNINVSTDIGNLYNTSNDTYTLNNAGPPGEGQSQNLCELIEYGRVLTSNEILTVQEYLNSKWGLGLNFSNIVP